MEANLFGKRIRFPFRGNKSQMVTGMVVGNDPKPWGRNDLPNGETYLIVDPDKECHAITGDNWTNTTRGEAEVIG